MITALLFLGVLTAVPPAADDAPQKAFALLKSLAGEWADPVTTKEGPAANVRFQVTSGGNTVMETQFPGTGHEMVSMYYLDHGSLVVKHFCAMGNQPEMKLDSDRSTASELTFVFTGGTNLDPKKDVHVHSGRIRIIDSDNIESDWATYQNGAPAGSHRFVLKREGK